MGVQNKQKIDFGLFKMQPNIVIVLSQNSEKLFLFLFRC